MDEQRLHDELHEIDISASRDIVGMAISSGRRRTRSRYGVIIASTALIVGGAAVVVEQVNAANITSDVAIAVTALKNDTASIAASEPSLRTLLGPAQEIYYGGVDPVEAQHALDNKQLSAVNDCLTGHGVDNLPAMTMANARRTVSIKAYNTQLADETTRRTQGYGVASQYLSTTKGDAVGACINEHVGARHSLPPEMVEFFTALDAANNTTANQVRKIQYDEAVAAQWSRCMRDRGFEYSRSSEVRDFVQRRANEVKSSSEALSKLRNEEIELAEADWTCTQRALTPEMLEKRHEVEKEFIESNRELAQRAQDAMKRYLGF